MLYDILAPNSLLDSLRVAPKTRIKYEYIEGAAAANVVLFAYSIGVLKHSAISEGIGMGTNDLRCNCDR